MTFAVTDTARRARYDKGPPGLLSGYDRYLALGVTDVSRQDPYIPQSMRAAFNELAERLEPVRGTRPLEADLLREALQRGLRAMEADVQR